MLITTSVVRGEMVANRYIHADEVVGWALLNRKIPQCSDRARPVLLWLSEQTQSLLNSTVNPIERRRFRGAYLYRLHEMGLASAIGTLHVSKIIDQMAKRYSNAGLEEYSGPQFTMLSDWMVERILDGGAPLRGLLIMHFLDLSVSDFLRLTTQPPWFGDGPWPCLHPTCPNQGKNVISDCDLELGSHKRPITTFTCACGYTYKRQEPDRNGKNPASPCRSVENDAWDRALRTLWRNECLALEDVKSQLHTTYNSLLRALPRLGLNPRDKEKRNGRWPRKPYVLKVISQEIEARREEQRSALLNWLKLHTQASKSNVSHALDKFWWLRKNDYEWLMRRLPGTENPKPIGYGAQKKRNSEKLKAMDELIASQVPIIKQVLVSQPGRPKRATAAKILVALGIPNGLGTAGNG